jgi:hypothetical protein
MKEAMDNAAQAARDARKATAQSGQTIGGIGPASDPRGRSTCATIGYETPLLVGMILFVLSYILVLIDAPAFLAERDKPPMVITSQPVNLIGPPVPFPRPMADVQSTRR